MARAHRGPNLCESFTYAYDISVVFIEIQYKVKAGHIFRICCWYSPNNLKYQCLFFKWIMLSLCDIKLTIHVSKLLAIYLKNICNSPHFPHAHISNITYLLSIDYKVNSNKYSTQKDELNVEIKVICVYFVYLNICFSVFFLCDQLNSRIIALWSYMSLSLPWVNMLPE